MHQDVPNRATASHVLLVGFMLVICLGLIFLCTSLMLTPALGDGAPPPAIPPNKVLHHATEMPKDPPSHPGLNDRALLGRGSDIMRSLSDRVAKLISEKKLTYNDVLDPRLAAKEIAELQSLVDQAVEPYGPGACQVRRMLFTVLVHCGLYAQGTDLFRDMIQHTSGPQHAQMQKQLGMLLYQHNLIPPLDTLFSEIKGETGADPEAIAAIAAMDQAAHVEVGKPLPDFKFPDMLGTIRRASDYLGHPLIIALWSSQDGQTARELPALARLREAHAADAPSLLGLDWDPMAKPSDALITQMKCPQIYVYPIWHHLPAAPFGVTHLPTYLLVSSQGILLAKAESVDALATAMQSAVHAR